MPFTSAPTSGGHRPAKDIQNTGMFYRKMCSSLWTIYALSDADFDLSHFLRDSLKKNVKSLKKQSSSRRQLFTSAPTYELTDPQKTFRTHVCSTEKESI